jgi:hypothetical protein
VTEHDLLSYLPENFAEIPYISAINTKKKVMEAFNSDLEKIVKKPRQTYSVLNKDYT